MGEDPCIYAKRYREVVAERDAVIEENKKLKQRYKNNEQLDKIAEQDNCEGDCDSDPPYERCPECIARSAMNESAEVIGYALDEIKESAKGVEKKGE